MLTDAGSWYGPKEGHWDEVVSNCQQMASKIKGMLLRVQHVDGEYRVVLTAEAMQALHLTEGAEVEVRSISDGSPSGEPATSKYITVAEALESYDRTEPLHRNTYRELAK